MGKAGKLLSALVFSVFVVHRAAAGVPAEAVVGKSLKWAGSPELSSPRALELVFEEEETTQEGKKVSNSFRFYIGNLAGSLVRLELPNGWVLVKSPRGNWAAKGDKLDKRPLTPDMASGTINGKLFPVLLPFSLKWDGVFLEGVKEISYEGRAAYLLTVKFAKGFFASPPMDAEWEIVIDKATGAVLEARFEPKEEYKKVGATGVLYRFGERKKIEGFLVPTMVTMEEYPSSGGAHVRITKLSWKVLKRLEQSMFIDPETLEKLESGEVMAP